MVVWAADIEIAAHGLASLAALLRRSSSMSSKESLAHDAHPSTEDHDHDDTIEAQFSGLERLRPCACMNGTVFIGHLVVGDDGEEVEVIEAVPCRHCVERS